jgi:L-aspartate oxidase
MGGIVTDADGRTSLAGLYAAGECAATGVHGANRLASNSLLEAAVFGRRAGLAAREEADPETVPVRAPVPPRLPDEALQVLRRAMSADAGVIRHAEGLKSLLLLIGALEARHGRSASLAAARLVAACALARTESRGAHFRTDAPEQRPPKRTFVTLAEVEPALKFAAE